MKMKTNIIYEDNINGKSVYFDEDGDLICESFSSGENGYSMNVITKDLQKKIYDILKEKFNLSGDN
jgi:hypothetical protein